MKLTKELVLAGVDPKKVTMDELKAFADELGLVMPPDGTKLEILADFAEQINAQAEEEDLPPDNTDLNIPDAPPEPGEEKKEESGAIPSALKRRGIETPKRVVRKKAELPKDAPPALKRRWGKS